MQDGGQAAGRAFDPTTTAMMPSEVVTRLVLLRHGEVESFGERVVRGQLDAAQGALGDRLAVVLEPLGQNGLLDRFAYTGDCDVNDHGFWFLLYPA